MFTLRCTSIASAYEKGVDYIINNGVMKEIHGTKVWQADPCTLEINIHDDADWSDRAPLGKLSSETYCKEFLNPDKGDHPYTYGERLRAYPIGTEIIINQISYIADTLIEEFSSRQAVATIWHPLRDTLSDSPPCLQYVQGFENTKGELEFVFLFRSNDWYQALMNNLQGLKITANTVAERIGVPCKKISLIAVCPHVYWYNLEEVCRKWGYGKEKLSKMQL